MKKSFPLLAVWLGQVVSLFGSGLTGFALGVWLYQQTGSASNFALVALCSALPQLILSPLAGVLVDRYNRRILMALADSGSALCTLAAAALFFSGGIEVWHIFVITALSAACGALQAPAYSALVAGAVPPDGLARANGMIQLGQGLAEILAPAAAGVLVLAIGVPGVMLIDLATFLIAVLALLFSRIPAEAPPTAEERRSNGLAAFWREARHGWEYLRSDSRLTALLSFQGLFSFLWNLFAVLVTPMVLGFADADGLGIALTVAGGGMLAGSLAMSVWGGPKRRLAGLLGFELISAVAFVLMGLRPSLILVCAAAFIAHWTLAFVSSLNEALWQANTPAEVRGRVFAFKQAAVKAAVLLAYALAGALADRVLNPLLLADGPLASTLGQVVGVGAGRGIALLFILIGVVKAISALRLGLSPALSRIDGQAGPQAGTAHGHHGAG